MPVCAVLYVMPMLRSLETRSVMSDTRGEETIAQGSEQVRMAPETHQQ